MAYASVYCIYKYGKTGRQTDKQTDKEQYLFIYLFIIFLVAQFRLFHGDLCLGILTVCSPADRMIHNKTSVT